MEKVKTCPVKTGPCTKEGCAWWEKIFEDCAMTVMGGAMAFVAGEMMERTAEDEEK